MAKGKGQGPALPAITGMKLGTLIRVLHRNRFRVDIRCVGRLAMLIAFGALNTALEPFENRESIEAEQIDTPPLFVIGHWRSGTSHLHSLLGYDENFVSPTTYQCMFPRHFHYSQRMGSKVFDRIAPEKRPMDDMALSAGNPWEDEFALAALSTVSPYMRFLFPVTGDNGYSALDSQALSGELREEWKQSLIYFLKSLTFWKDDKRILLKSPPHTCRVKTLLELFPAAQFVHIVRNPYEVYMSNRKLWMGTLARVHLQIPDPETVDEIILSWYTELFSLYERDRDLIPPGALHELKYEDLIRTPKDCLEKLYRDLALPGFDRYWERVAVYLESIKEYKKSAYDIDHATRDKVSRRWRKTFDDYGYSVD
jgi:hypothetical protein